MENNFELLPKNYKEVINIVNIWSKKLQCEIYAVGGFVRDLVMGQISDDMDFVIDKKGIDNPAIYLANILEEEGIGINKALYEKFGTAKLEINGLKTEFVMPRTEIYNEDNRKPECKKIDLKEDAIRRDFTINTLMLNLETKKIIDSTGYGLNDIKNKIIRSANPDINKMVFDDGLRMLRAARFSATKGFTIDKDLEDCIIKNVERIDIISKERIREELDKILMADKGDIWFFNCMKRIMERVIPEIIDLWNCMEKPPYHWDESTYKHTIRTIYNCPKEINIRRAALFHDIGKPAMRTVDGDKVHYYGHDIKSAYMAQDIMRRLTYSNDEIKVVKLLIANHMRPHLYKPAGHNKGHWGDNAVRKYIVEMGEWLDLSIALAYADSKGSGPEDREQLNFNRMKLFEEHIKRVKTKPIISKPIINGERIMQIFDRPAGKWISHVMQYQMGVLFKNPEISIIDLEKRIFDVFRKRLKQL